MRSKLLLSECAGKTYRVATNDFLLRGGDGYTAFRDGKLLLPADD